MKVDFDLLTLVKEGGCSAKIPPDLLDSIVGKIPILQNKNLLVGTETHDDAAVWKLSSEQALIQTTDFFPPLCSDPYEFGQIAACNALSDVFAMGGEAIMAMNLVMFPSKLDMKILEAILLGGAEKVKEAGAVLCGGHTIDDATPKFGLAVAGLVHPQKITTNAGVKPGQVLILTKGIGTGVLMSGKKVGLANSTDYQKALESMKLLNKEGARLMREYGVSGATDITGFGLLGHALKMAKGSAARITLKAEHVPFLSGAYDLAEQGCLPGASFRNLKYVEKETSFSANLDYNLKMLLSDAQSSGGLFMAVDEGKAQSLVQELKAAGFPMSAVIGKAQAYHTGSYLVVE